MSEISLDNWSQSEYAKEYRDNSDRFLQDRATLLRIAASFTRAFLPPQGSRILDLGCGDGVLSLVVSRALPAAEIVAADGSPEMIAAARDRLQTRPISAFHCIRFQEIIAGHFNEAPFDCIVSSLAIHHLLCDEKAALFHALIPLLTPGGYFLNADVILPEQDAYSDWYYALWQEWLLEREAAEQAQESFAHVPARARNNPENHFDALSIQLDALRTAGFREVECHYRYGLFGIYSGRAPNARKK